MILKIVMWAIIAGLVLLVIRLIKENDDLHKEVMDKRLEECTSEDKMDIGIHFIKGSLCDNKLKMKFELYRPRKRGFAPPIDEKEIFIEMMCNNYNKEQNPTDFFVELMKKNGYSTSMTYQEFQNFDLKEEENMKIGII